MTTLSVHPRIAMLADLLEQEQQKTSALALRCTQLMKERDLAKGEATIAQRVIMDLRIQRDRLLIAGERRC